MFKIKTKKIQKIRSSQPCPAIFQKNKRSWLEYGYKIVLRVSYIWQENDTPNEMFVLFIFGPKKNLKTNLIFFMRKTTFIITTSKQHSYYTQPSIMVLLKDAKSKPHLQQMTRSRTGFLYPLCLAFTFACTSLFKIFMMPSSVLRPWQWMMAYLCYQMWCTCANRRANILVQGDKIKIKRLKKN